MQQANTNIVIRNPFGTMDVPAPGDSEVMHYAITATLAGDAADPNAAHWASIPVLSDPLEGAWASRWNGGADPTIAGDTPEHGSKAARKSASWANGSICGSIGTVAEGTD